MKKILITLALAASAVFVQAQPEGGGNPPPPGGPRSGGPDGPRRPVPPLLAALDADKDGELSADEIANAATALKALDKDNDGKISKEELRPGPPRDGGGRPGGPPGGGPGGPPRGQSARNGEQGGLQGHFRGPRPEGPPHHAR